MREKVSIIISTYNRPQTIEIALLSVMKQEFTNWKVYVVNDGGCDIPVVSHAAYRSKLQYTKLPDNVGSYKALNVGIRQSKGEFIIFLDDDDMFFPNALTDLLSGFSSSFMIATYAKCERHHTYKEPITKELIPPCKVNLTHDRILQKNWVPMSAWMVRASFLRQRNGFDEKLKYLADWDLLCEIALFYKIEYVDAVVSKVILHKDSRSIKGNGVQSQYRQVVRDKYNKQLSVRR